MSDEERVTLKLIGAFCKSFVAKAPYSKTAGYAAL